MMSAEVMIQDSTHDQEPDGSPCEWVRLRFAGLTPGNPPTAAFQGRFTLRHGETKHARLNTRVHDETLQLRLLNLEAGSEVRILIETNWKQPELLSELKDVVLIVS